MNAAAQKKEGIGGYMPLAVAAGIGSMLGSGIIVGLSATITVWQNGLGLDTTQVGLLSGILTFAIAFGSLFGGRLADKIGRVLVFNWINLLYAIGAAICVFAPDFTVLLIGLIIAGVASGADLPISMTIVSHDAPNDKVAAQLVSTTQVFWQVGVFISFICAFLVSTMEGAMGGRVVFAILAVFAVIAWLWRLISPTFRRFHEEADARDAAAGHVATATEKVSVTKMLFAGTENSKMLLGFFLAITIFYCGWNLLANTWGQFQTYMLVQANASQSLATGLGIILNFITLALNIAFASIAGGKYRNKLVLRGHGHFHRGHGLPGSGRHQHVGHLRRHRTDEPRWSVRRRGHVQGVDPGILPNRDPRLHPGLHQRLLPPAVRPVRPDHPGPRAAVHHQDHHVVLRGRGRARTGRRLDHDRQAEQVRHRRGTPAQGLFRRSMIRRRASPAGGRRPARR